MPPAGRHSSTLGCRVWSTKCGLDFSPVSWYPRVGAFGQCTDCTTVQATPVRVSVICSHSTLFACAMNTYSQCPPHLSTDILFVGSFEETDHGLKEGKYMFNFAHIIFLD